MSIDNSHKIEAVKILLAKGVDGVGIEKIEKTGSSGIVDTYTITYTDSRKTTFEITNGNGIESIEKTSTVLLNDVYTITYEDGSTTTYNVTNGRGIDRIEKTSTVGAVDTYTIYYNDNTTSTYTVTNGQGAVAEDISFTNNGEGATNVQDAVDNTLKLVAPIQLTLTADKTYNVGDQFVYNGLLYEVTATIAQGTPITVGSNVQLADTVAEQLSEINSNLSAHTFGSTVDLSSYVSVSYTFPNDGYVEVKADAGSPNNVAAAYIRNNDDTDTMFTLAVYPVDNGAHTNFGTIQVKAGMRVRTYHYGNYSIRFIPVVN